MKNQSKSTININNPISEYLSHYIGSPLQKRAVYINGEWGTGKTWFIEDFIRKNRDTKFIYISMFGIKHMEDLKFMIFEKNYKATSKAIRLVETIFNTFKPQYEEISIEVNAKVLTNKYTIDKTYVLIFDDLERCTTDPSTALGFINQYVEKHENKVIIIANDKEAFASNALDKEKFELIKEKTIGRTFEIKTDISSACEHFIGSDLVHKTGREKLKENIATIVKVFDLMKLKNLRTLEFCISEYLRFFELLPTKVKLNDGFIRESIESLFAIAIEYKQAKLDVESLPISWSIDTLQPISESNSEDFKKIDIFPNGEIYYHFFKYGSIPQVVLDNSINNSRYFIAESQSSWIRLWYVHQLNEVELALHYSKVISQFKNLEFTNLGELKHVIAILLKFAHNEIVNVSLTDMCSLIDNTLAQMFEKKVIKTKNTDKYMDHHRSYGGLGFSESGTTAFNGYLNKINEHLVVMEEEASKKDSEILLKNMISNNEEAFTNLFSKYSHRAFLNFIDAQQFVEALVKCDGELRHEIYLTLHERYRYNDIHLKNEYEWLNKVKLEIEKIRPTLKQPIRFQINELLENVIQHAISGPSNVGTNEVAPLMPTAELAEDAIKLSTDTNINSAPVRSGDMD